MLAPYKSEIDPTPVYSPVGKLLLDAAELIRRYGWIQGGLGSPEHGFCLHGAINFAHHRLSAISQSSEIDATLIGAHNAAGTLVKEHHGLWKEDIWHSDGTHFPAVFAMNWNDHQCRSKHEAIAVLEHAADRHIISGCRPYRGKLMITTSAVSFTSYDPAVSVKTTVPGDAWTLATIDYAGGGGGGSGGTYTAVAQSVMMTGIITKELVG